MLNITTQLVTVPVTVSGVTVIVSAAVPGGGGGGGGATTWGSITGTLASQGDLNSALNDRLLASAVSAFGLTLIDDANASAARATLGLGTASTSALGDFAAAVHAHSGTEIATALPVTVNYTPGSDLTAYLMNIDTAFGLRASTTHTHGNITTAGAIGSTASLPIITGSSGVLQAGTFGTASGSFCQGNDARLSDDRTPTAHTHALADIQQGGATSGQVLEWSGSAWAPATLAGGGGGTVTSVIAGTGLTGGTITSTGTIAADFGTAAGTICQGNDSRLSDSRTPTSHTHGNITNAGAIGSTSGVPIITGASGVLQAGSFGTTAGTFAEGNDARLADQTITLTGDVTGSGTGSFSATIANDAVTYAKIQNVSTTDRLLGRSTAGAGDVEEITCTAAGRALLDDADASAQRTTLGLGTAATQATGAFEAAGSIATHAGTTTGVHGISAFGATLVDDADAATARTTLGLGTAATSATGDFAAASHNHAAGDITSGTLAVARGGTGSTGFITPTNYTASSATVSFHLAGIDTALGNRLLASAVSAFGLTLVDDADAATARTTLGAAASDVLLGEVSASVDGGGSAPTAVTLERMVERATTVVSASLVGDVSGSISVTVKRDRASVVTTLGTVALSSAKTIRDTTLTGWTTDLLAGDILICEFGAGTTLTRATLTLGRRAT